MYVYIYIHIHMYIYIHIILISHVPSVATLQISTVIVGSKNINHPPSHHQIIPTLGCYLKHWKMAGSSIRRGEWRER